jgi:ATP-dependent RNA helicase MSS116
MITKFEELSRQGLVNHAIIDEITKTMGHHTMTQVQTMTINTLLRGTDV